MNLEEYKEKVENSQQEKYIKEHINELMELFCDLADLKTLSYYKYEYEFNDYFHKVTLITSPINNLNYNIIWDGKNRCKKIITKRVV